MASTTGVHDADRNVSLMKIACGRIYYSTFKFIQNLYVSFSTLKVISDCRATAFLENFQRR